MNLVQNFTAFLMVQRPDFYLLPFGRYSGKRNGKNLKIKNLTPTLYRFSRSKDRFKKKLTVRKCTLCLPLLESKRISFLWIINRHIYDLVRYPFGKISKSFYSALPLGLFLPSPVCYKRKTKNGESEKTKIREGRAKDINKPNANAE
jgi:hypothetical protein